MSADLGAQAVWPLIPVAAVYGVVSVLVFRKFTSAAQIRRSVNLMWAHGMELSLFLHSPALVLAAQRDLLRENVRLLRAVILPGIVLALLFACLFPPMKAFFGRAPLPLGKPSVVTIQLKTGLLPTVRLEPPSGIVVETPPVRVPRDGQISWRVRPARLTSDDLKFRLDDRVLSAGMHTFFLHDSSIRSIDIRYPNAAILGLPWLVWFFAISGASALTLGLSWKR